MPENRKLIIAVGIIILAIAAGLGWRLLLSKGKTTVAQNTPTQSGFQLLSTAFKSGQPIPVKYTCKGENINPPLNIQGVPPTAKSLALILHDPDAVSGDFVHWTLWNLDSTNTALDEGNIPVEAVQGANSTDNSGYIGPCPPSGTGTHHYTFDLYALDDRLNLSGGAKANVLKDMIKQHQVAKTTLIGTFAVQ